MRREIEKKRNNESGFTLLEMMIVVAIIAVLVVISIPTFTGILEKGREATDLANVRSAYAEVMIAAITQDTTSTLYDSSLSQYRKDVKLSQKIKGWETEESELNIGGVAATDKAHWKGTPVKGGKCKVIYDSLSDKVSLIWSGCTIEIDHQWEGSNDKAYSLNTQSNVKSWPASAVNEFIDAKVGQKVVVKQITEDEFPNLYDYITNKKGGYEIGIATVDPDSKLELADTGGQVISTTSSNSFSINAGDKASSGSDVKLAISFFKMQDANNRNKGSVLMTEDEAEELERIFEITD